MENNCTLMGSTKFYCTDLLQASVLMLTLALHFLKLTY